jgi:hypothetical protein
MKMEIHVRSEVHMTLAGSAGMWHRDVWQADANVLEGHVTSSAD